MATCPRQGSVSWRCLRSVRCRRRSSGRLDRGRATGVNSRKLIATALIIATPLMLAIVYRPDRAIRVATGLVAHNVCSKSFVSGLDPDTVFAETTERAGIRLLRQ